MPLVDNSVNLFVQCDEEHMSHVQFFVKINYKNFS